MVPSGSTPRRDRIRKQAQHSRVREAPPAHIPGPGATVGATREPTLAEAGDHTVGRPRRFEGREDVRHRRPDLFIGVHDRVAIAVVDVADGKGKA
jgi:hypothetical protein